MEKPHERLRRKRKERFKSAAAFARLVGTPPPTYRMHERGERRFGVPIAERYSEPLGVTSYWLLTGRDPPEVDAEKRRANRLVEHLPPEVRDAWLISGETMLSALLPSDAEEHVEAEGARHGGAG